jgi:hypothetical protein
MHKSIEALVARLPLDFRVLYRQFLLRVIDLEALSIQADVVGFLGQFAGVLIMLSIIHAFRIYLFLGVETWPIEQYLIATMMLVAGLIVVISWDATFPDRRDAMVLSPLPVAPHTILFAKIAASCAVLGLSILALNVFSGLVCPLLLGAQHGTTLGRIQSFAAYWFTMAAASAFLYCSVLTAQGLTALLLPRRLFLRLSAILQLAAFGLFLGVYFVQGTIATPAAMADPANQRLLAWSPSFWFFALFNQLNGSLPPQFSWLASRAWAGLGTVVVGATLSLILCYVRTMKKTVEEPDLVPGAGGSHWAPNLGPPLQTALVLFSFRSLTRSRQHRVLLAFYFSVVFAIALSLLRTVLSAPAPIPLSPDFYIPTLMMMSFAVFGLRSVFSLPISPTANWVLRATQLCSSERYVAATRRTLLFLGVAPVWLVSALLSLSFRPFHHVAAHLALLALYGWILSELGLIGFYKVPFTCSYLPGKSNIQLVFWGFLVVLLVVVMSIAEFEQRALHDPILFVSMSSAFAAMASGLWAFNRHQAKSAVIYFEELPDVAIQTLGLQRD